MWCARSGWIGNGGPTPWSASWRPSNTTKGATAPRGNRGAPGSPTSGPERSADRPDLEDNDESLMELDSAVVLNILGPDTAWGLAPPSRTDQPTTPTG